MRKIVLLFLSLFVFISFIHAQIIIENLEKPLSKNAGREVELKEVIQIIDTGEDFYFKYPHNLKIAPDGSIFVQDAEQLLHFSPEGKFIRNFFKKGQG
ncbi:MAG: hypothetical protein U9Q97_04520, partial [Acidobacteriota bacterium]|nr:hypothetical protein [Acidobacteriota bacterium]